MVLMGLSVDLIQPREEFVNLKIDQQKLPKNETQTKKKRVKLIIKTKQSIEAQ